MPRKDDVALARQAEGIPLVDMPLRAQPLRRCEEPFSEVASRSTFLVETVVSAGGTQLIPTELEDDVFQPKRLPAENRKLLLLGPV